MFCSILVVFGLMLLMLLLLLLLSSSSSSLSFCLVVVVRFVRINCLFIDVVVVLFSFWQLFPSYYVAYCRLIHVHIIYCILLYYLFIFIFPRCMVELLSFVLRQSFCTSPFSCRHFCSSFLRTKSICDTQMPHHSYSTRSTSMADI